MTDDSFLIAITEMFYWVTNAGLIHCQYVTLIHLWHCVLSLYRAYLTIYTNLVLGGPTETSLGYFQVKNVSVQTLFSLFYSLKVISASSSLIFRIPAVTDIALWIERRNKSVSLFRTAGNTQFVKENLLVTWVS